ncbi:hypothetical protein Tco_1238503 [Tanacetum coccineum]
MPLNMLGPDINGKAVNESQYRGMIGSLMNLTASRTDIQFLTGIYARHQANISNPTLLLLRELSAMFSAEAEDIADAGCCANILWIKSQLIDYDIIYEKIKNYTLKRDIEFHFIPTQYQLAAIFIKLLDKPSFKRLIDEIVCKPQSGLHIKPDSGLHTVKVLKYDSWMGVVLDIKPKEF